jgi:hypothetical protein
MSRTRSTDPPSSYPDEKETAALTREYLTALYKHPSGLSSYEISRIYHGNGGRRDSYSPRGTQCAEKGWVERCPNRIVEKDNGKKRSLIAYRLTAKGRMLFEPTSAPSRVAPSNYLGGLFSLENYRGGSK